MTREASRKDPRDAAVVAAREATDEQLVGSACGHRCNEQLVGIAATSSSWGLLVNAV